MSNVLSVRIPRSLHQDVKELAEAEGVSMNQFVMLAIAEKVAALQTVDYLSQRAGRGNRGKLTTILEKAPDVEPADYDKLD